MNKQTIVFIGGIGNHNKFGGELTKNKELISKLKTLGFKVITVDTFQSHHSILRFIKFIFRILYVFLIYRSSAFIFSTAFPNVYPLFKIINKLPTRYKIIYWAIGGIFSEKVLNGEFRIDVLKTIGEFVVEGKKMQSELNEAGFKNVVYVPNFKKIGAIPFCEKFNDGKIHFLFMSRITRGKGCDIILESAEELNSNGYKDKYVIDFYGNIDNAYEDEFHSRLKSLHNVNYKGSINLRVESNYKTISRYHYMLFPTFWKGEGFPGVIIDAYKSGLPVIGSDWNFNSEFIENEKTGIIIPTHNAEALKMAMINCIEGRYDYQEMSKICHLKVKDYDVDKVITKELIQNLIK